MKDIPECRHHVIVIEAMTDSNESLLPQGSVMKYLACAFVAHSTGKICSGRASGDHVIQEICLTGMESQPRACEAMLT